MNTAARTPPPLGPPADGAWAVIEANAAWASGHYACDGDAALEVLLRSSRPRAEVPAADVPFLRALRTGPGRLS